MSYNLDTVGQGPTALAVGAGGGCLDIFTLNYPFSPLSPSLWETARYRLKYCLKGPLNPKQPTNRISSHGSSLGEMLVCSGSDATVLLERNAGLFRIRIHGRSLSKMLAYSILQATVALRVKCWPILDPNGSP